MCGWKPRDGGNISWSGILWAGEFSTGGTLAVPENTLRGTRILK